MLLKLMLIADFPALRQCETAETHNVLRIPEQPGDTQFAAARLV